VFVNILDPQLKGGGDAGLERGLQPVGKTSADLLRADQIELARPALRRPERIRKLLSDLVQVQTGPRATEAS
jgi:hypothetical protein